MCGIHFVVNTKPYTADLDGFMKNAFVANMLRGTDSSGMFQIQNTFKEPGFRNIHTYKSVSQGVDFIEEARARELLTAATRTLATVGHVRAATHGSVNVANAHPFVTVRDDGSRIIGVHNGSLNGWADKTDAGRFDVDSQWLYHKLAKDGIEAFKEFDGAFALIWADSRKPDSLFIARNAARPLYYGFTKGKGAMIGASELGMLGWLADRNKLEIEADKDGYRFFYPQPGKIFEMNINDLSRTVTDFPEYDSKSRRYVRPHVPQPYTPAPARASSNVLSIYDPSNSRRFEQYDIGRQNRMLKSISAALAKGRSKAALLAAPAGSKEALLEEAIGKVIEAEASIVEKEDDSVISGDDLTTAMEVEIDKWMDDNDRKREEALYDSVPWDEAGKSILKLAHEVKPNNPRAAAPLDGSTKEDDFQFISSPPDASAGKEERASAKSLGIYGLVVNFCGYFHEDETGEVFGDFHTIEGGKAMSYDAIVRGQSGMAAHSKYIHPSKLTEMTVIGITQPKQGSKPYIILADKPRGAAFTTAAQRKQATA